MKSLSEKVVIINGAAGGAGRALAARFLKEGARVCAVDNSSELLEELSVDFGAPEELFTIKADIGRQESCEKLLIKLQQKWKSADVLINAGWIPFTDFETTYSEWRRVIDVNIDGTFSATKTLIPLLKESTTGRIIHISTGSFLDPPPNRAHYLAAKAGVKGFTRALAIALGKYNITVNAVIPGLPEGFPRGQIPSVRVDKVESQRGLRKTQTFNELIGTILFLVSKDAAIINGLTLR